MPLKRRGLRATIRPRARKPSDSHSHSHSDSDSDSGPSITWPSEALPKSQIPSLLLKKVESKVIPNSMGQKASPSLPFRSTLPALSPSPLSKFKVSSLLPTLNQGPSSSPTSTRPSRRRPLLDSSTTSSTPSLSSKSSITVANATAAVQEKEKDHQESDLEEEKEEEDVKTIKATPTKRITRHTHQLEMDSQRTYYSCVTLDEVLYTVKDFVLLSVGNQLAQILALWTFLNEEGEREDQVLLRWILRPGIDVKARKLERKSPEKVKHLKT